VSEASTERVAAFIAKHDLDAEIIATPDGVPTVETAAAALGVGVDQILKTLVFVDPNDLIVIGIASGTGRVDRAKLAAAAGTGKLKLAPATLVFDATGYAPGGVAPFDLPSEIPVVVDETAAAQREVFGGSGTDLHMMRVHMADVIRLNEARIAPILQDPTG
jgi:prolyl-tRNA editing enzyme YbaK/EbsC (Cys-tRNA(Pro) deacylase)